MRLVLTILLLIISLSLQSQVTFERIYPFSTGYAIEQLPDGSFIGCGDSLQTGLIFKIDSVGNLKWTFAPKLRDTVVSVNDITRDPISGGYAICGRAVDTSGSNSTGYYLLLDSMLIKTDSLFYSGASIGPSAEILHWKKDTGFVLGLRTYVGVNLTNLSVNIIDYPATNSFHINDSSHITNNSLSIDSSGKMLVASYNWSYASLQVFDETGIPLGAFTITDTAYGGSLIYLTSSAPTLDGNYMFSAHVIPNSLSYSFDFLTKLDTGLNILWSKYMDWGYSANLMGITATYDSCIVLLLNTGNGLAIHKLNSSGDSLWTQFHNRPTSGPAFRFQQCADHGFVIVGQMADTSGNHAYVLKTDSLGRLFPDATLNIIGTQEICQGDSVVLSAKPGYFYLWSTGETTQSITVSTSADYFVTVTDAGGLSVQSDSIHIHVHPAAVPPSITDSSGMLHSSQANSYQWFFDGMMIPNSDTIAIFPALTGYYTVLIVDSNGCTAISDSFYYDITAISNFTNNDLISVYPNPSGGKFYIEQSSYYSEEKLIEVFDLVGKRVFHKLCSGIHKIQIELNVSPGIYTLSVKGKNEVKRKILVE